MKIKVTREKDGNFVIANAENAMSLTARVSIKEDRVAIGMFAVGDVASVFATYPLSFLQAIVDEAVATPEEALVDEAWDHANESLLDAQIKKLEPWEPSVAEGSFPEPETEDP